jgi:hypothetical protein
MAIREVDAISDAIIATEREIAGDAWGQEETDALDATGDRSHEDMGEGLEGQHELEGDDDAEGEDADGEGETEGKGEGEGEGETVGEVDAEAAAAAAATAAAAAKAAGKEPPAGRVPPGVLREANERARAAEAERDSLKGQLGTFNEQLAQAMRRIDDLSRAPRVEPLKVEPVVPKAAPDMFEDPKGFVEHLTGLIETKLSGTNQQLENTRLDTSFAIAHAFHKDTFETAYQAINKLNPQNPDDRATVQRIMKSPNPGEALVNWHKRSQTLAEVGDDPAAYREKVAKETREALMKDPEFRKSLVAELRGEASRPGPDGSPNVPNRLPPIASTAHPAPISAPNVSIRARVTDSSSKGSPTPPGAMSPFSIPESVRPPRSFLSAG